MILNPMSCDALFFSFSINTCESPVMLTQTRNSCIDVILRVTKNIYIYFIKSLGPDYGPSYHQHNQNQIQKYHLNFQHTLLTFEFLQYKARLGQITSSGREAIELSWLCPHRDNSNIEDSLRLVDPLEGSRQMCIRIFASIGCLLVSVVSSLGSLWVLFQWGGTRRNYWWRESQ